MSSYFSPRPQSSFSKGTTTLSDQKIGSPIRKYTSPAITTAYSQPTGDGLFSPDNKFSQRPFSAEQNSGFQDEIKTNSSFQNHNQLIRSTSNILQQMKSVLKPKKAQSAKQSLKGKKSPLLIYKDSMNSFDDYINQPEIINDFSKQYSLIKMQEQVSQNEKQTETCPFGAFSAFRKEDIQNLKKRDRKNNSQTSISKSKFFSKPISIGSPSVLSQKNISIDFTKSTLASLTDTNRYHKSNKETIQNSNTFYLDNDIQKTSLRQSITSQSKRISKHAFVVVQETPQKDINQSSAKNNLEKNNEKQTQNTIDQRINLNSLFLMSPDKSKNQAKRFLINGQNQSLRLSTENNDQSTQAYDNHITSSSQKKTQLSIQSSLMNLQLWPLSATSRNSKSSRDNIIQEGVDINFIKAKKDKKNQKKGQVKTQQSQKKDEIDPKIILKSMPDYKFDSNYKAVSNHLDLKAKKLTLNEKPKTPLIQIHFSRKQVENLFQKDLENNKLKYCEAGKFIGNKVPQEIIKTEKQVNKKTNNKKQVVIENDRFAEYQALIESDQKERAMILQRQKDMVLLNLSSFSDSHTEDILDDTKKAIDIFPNANKWIIQSPIGDMLQEQYPNVKNYVDKIWSYYQEKDENEVNEELNTFNNQVSIKAIEEQNDSIKFLYDQISKMNEVFQQRVDSSNKVINKQLIDSYLKINDERLTQQELHIIINEFEQKQEEINYSLIDQILCKLKFFTNFNPMTRKQLLKLGKLIKKEKGDIVFNQGDFGDQMYVIIFGSCNVQVKTINEEGFEMDRVVATLYDGQQFGELAMMKTTTKKQKQQTGEVNMKEKNLKDIKLKIKRYEAIYQLERQYQRRGIRKTRSQIELEYDQISKQQKKEKEEEFNELDEANQTKKNDVQVLERTKRAATIQLIEETYLISISKSDFQVVLMDLMQAELDNKIKLLSSIHLFDVNIIIFNLIYIELIDYFKYQMFQPFALIPLANLLKLKKYSVNDLIVEQGKPLKYFYIVSQGRLKVLRIEKTDRNIKRDLKPSHMIFSIMKYKEDEKEKREKEIKKGILKDIQQKPIYKDYDSSDYDSDEQDHEQVERLLRDSKLSNTEKIFDYSKFSKPNKKRVYYKKFVEYDSFSSGDYFGGRVLTNKNPENNPSGVSYMTVVRKLLKQKKNTLSKLYQKNQQIAETNEVEVYVFERNQLQYLPQFIKDWLLINLECVQEFDDINKKAESQKNKNWEKFKEQIYQSTVKQIKLQRNVQSAKIW